MTSIVPEISLISLEKQSKEDLVILKDALYDHGFFTITNHNIDLDLLDKSYVVAKEFFDLPEDVKMKYARPNIGGSRGYTPFGLSLIHI